MTNKQRILVIGDVHGDWSALNKLINVKQPEIILQCGDFGYWPRMQKSSRTIMTSQGERNIRAKAAGPKVPEGSVLYWCDGNHEDHHSLRDRETDELWPRTFYMPRGKVLTLPDGRTVMFAGGAASIDHNCRTYGIDWFPEEILTEKDVFAIAHEGPVDIMISHTLPHEFDVLAGKPYGYMSDPSRLALSYLLDHHRPKQWFNGHWHMYMTGYAKKCQWTSLDRVRGSNGRCWQWLPK